MEGEKDKKCACPASAGGSVPGEPRGSERKKGIMKLKWLLVLGLAGILGLGIGCSPFGDKDSKLGEMVLGKILQGIGLFAEVEKSSQDINSDNPDLKLPEGATLQNGRYFITCNYLDDMNGLGISFPDDYVWIKKKFTNKEQITFAVHSILVKKTNKIKFIAKDTNGRVVSSQDLSLGFTDNQGLAGKNCCYQICLSLGEGWSIGTEGTIRGIWYLDDNFIGFSEIEITK